MIWPDVTPRQRRKRIEWLRDLWALPPLSNPLPARLPLCHAVLLMAFHGRSIPSNAEAMLLVDQLVEARHSKFARFLNLQRADIVVYLRKQIRKTPGHLLTTGERDELLITFKDTPNGFTYSDPIKLLEEIEMRPEPWPRSAGQLHAFLSNFIESTPVWIEATERALSQIIAAVGTSEAERRLQLFGALATLGTGRPCDDPIPLTCLDRRQDILDDPRDRVNWQLCEIRDAQGSRWKNVKVACDQLLAFRDRTARTTSASAGAAKARTQTEDKWTEYLAGQMRAARDVPRSKDKIKATAPSDLPRIGKHAFDRAWTRAVEVSGAKAWSQVGRRRSQKIIPGEIAPPK